MANTRVKDYTKRLNYDELKDKLSKNKKVIDAPYRLATIIRNSNQMQNIINMNMIEMSEHQAEVQNEQIKQSKVSEVLSTQTTVKVPKKQMKSVGVDAGIRGKDRFTQAGAKTQDTGVNATTKSRSTGSDAIEPVEIHNSKQTEDESDLLQDQMDESVALLNRASQDDQQSSIAQNKSILGKAINVAQTLAKKGKGAALKAGKGGIEMGVTASLMGQGYSHEIAGLGASAAGAAAEAGYNYTFGGASSSGAQPMEVENVQKKRDPEDEVEPKGRRGRPSAKQQINRGDEVVLQPEKEVPTKSKAKAKAKTKAAKREEAEAEAKAFTTPETEVPSSSKNKGVKKDTTATKKNRDGHGVVKITDKTEKWWDKQNATVLKEQAALRGRVYTPLEAKGYKIIDPDDPEQKKKIWKEKPYKRDDYLRILKKMLKDGDELI